MSDRGTNGQSTVASSFQLEAMEPRLLLTTIYGGEIFSFIDPQDQVIHVRTTGSLILELIGAATAADDALLADLPGTIIYSPPQNPNDPENSGMGRSAGTLYEAVNNPYDDTLLNGGEGGRQGVIPITIDQYGSRTTAAIKGAPLHVDPYDAPAGEINIEALAVNDAGEIWALNRLESDQDPSIQLLHVNRTPNSDGFLVADVVGGNLYDELETALNGQEDFQIDAIRAADFNPINGLLFFVVSQGPELQDRLVSLDVTNPTATISASNSGQPFQDTQRNNSRVQDIAFDRTGANTAELAFYRTYVDEQGAQVAQLAYLQVDNNPAGPVNTSTFPNSRFVVDDQGNPILTLTGIEIPNDDPTKLDRYVYGSSSDSSDSQVVKIDTQFRIANQAQGREIGALDDPWDPDAVALNQRLAGSRVDGRTRGQNITDLAWDATSSDPFTGNVGAMIGIDADTDELVYVDLRERPGAANLFAIYVVKGDPNGTITIGLANDTGVDLTGDDSGAIRINDVIVSAPSESGAVYLGIKITDPDNSDELTLPKLELDATLLGSLGVRPAGEGTATAGLEVVKSLLKYVNSGEDWAARLMGQNIDRVRGLAVSRSGSAYVIDSDALGATANVLSGDQLFAINASTGNALPTAYDVVAAGTNEALYLARGLDYGDPTLSGVETLYTVYEINNSMVLGTLSLLNGKAVFTTVSTLAGLTDVSAMAFGPGQKLYVLGSTGGPTTLYQVNVGTGAVSVIATVNDPLRPGTPLQVNAMDFIYGENGQAYLVAHDVSNGRLVDISTTTGAVGAVFDTEVGSMNPLVGAISFDFQNRRLLAADNSTGIFAAVYERAVPDPNDSTNPTSVESAALMEVDLTGAKPQDLRRFILGGTLTGKVDISGSVDIFYAGWLITGNLGQNISLPNNFRVGRDLHNLMSIGTIGAADVIPVAPENEENYPGYSGFEMYVDGRVGMIRSNVSIMGQYTVANSDSLTDLSPLNDLFYEIEEPNVIETIASAKTEIPSFSSQIDFLNEDRGHAQFLAPVRSGPGGADSVRVQGMLLGPETVTPLTGDLTDYYAVPLMAGQTIGVQLVDMNSAAYSLRVGVMDPDGRIVASSYSNRDQEHVRQKEFLYTVERPGVYYFVVALVGDVNFDGEKNDADAGSPPFANWKGEREYELRISAVGDLAIGGMAAIEHVVLGAVETLRGDVGAVVADLTGENTGLVFGGGYAWAHDGNVRAILGSSIGINPQRLWSQDLGIYVYATGDVGSVKTTDVEGTMRLNVGWSQAIGGDFQLIDAAGIFNGNVIADGNIGVIRAGTLNTGGVVVPRSSFIAGLGGVIDLIDIVGDFGTLTMGGPHIEVGTGGNVRFIRVGGQLFTETMPESGPGDFTGSVLGWFRVTAGQTSPKLTDSTGATFYVSPVQEIINPSYNPFVDPVSERFLKNELEVWTYRIHGTSGLAVIALKTSHGGVLVKGDGDYEIGSIWMATEDGTVLLPGAASSITVNGNGKVDIFEIRDLDPETVEDASVPIGAIDNRTRGSIANINTLLSIGSLRTWGNIGVIESTTGAALNGMLPIRMPVEPRTTPEMHFPFDDQRIGVVARSFGPIWAGKAVGNVIALGSDTQRGTIESVTADGDNNFDFADNVFEGIAGPIFASGTIGTRHWVGPALTDFEQGGVNIGEGIAPSGSGFRASQAGLYALSGIGPIVGRRGANIYGDIAAGHNVDIDSTLPGVIASIRLDGGSIINADIMRATNIAMTAEWYHQAIVRGESAEPDAIKNPVFDIGSITLTGNGGIIGSIFHAPDIGAVRVDGFGIINSSFTADHGVINNVTAAGYGVRLTDFRANFVRNITASGGKELLATSNFSSDVTMSERQAYDTQGLATNRLSDLHAYLGTDIDHRTKDGVTDEGVIEAVQVATKELGQVSAWQIRSKSLDGTKVNTSLTADNNIRGISTNGDETAIINGLNVNTGRLGSFLPVSDVSDLQMTVAGPLGNIHIQGDLAGNSTITGSGRYGTISSLIIDGLADGSIYADGTIGKVELNEVGELTIRNTANAAIAIKTLILHQADVGTLDITGNVGTIQSDGDFGSEGDSLTIDGSVSSLIVGSLRPIAGSVLGLDLRVQGNLSRLQVYGQITGNVEVAGSLTTLDVTKASNGPSDLVLGDISVRRGFGTGRINNGNMAGDLRVGEGLSSLTITNGQLAGNVTAGGNIGTISVTNGDQQAGTAITSALGDIGSVRITGGDLLGSVRAPHGRIQSISVSGAAGMGNVGAGSVIAGESLGSLVVSQSVLSGARVEIEKGIDSVRIGQDFEAGATLSAGSAANITIGNDLAGAMTIGYSSTGTRLNVGRNLGADDSTVAIDANTQAIIGGDIVEGATLSVTRDLTTLQAGVVYGNVLVEGMAGTVRLQKMSSALLAVGFDLSSLSVVREIETSAIQVGADRGVDGTFAAGETRMGRIGSLTAATFDKSVIAAGGNIDRVTAGSMTDSSLSSGLVLNGGKLDDVRGGQTLFPGMMRDSVRTNATLYRGDIGSAALGSLTASSVTAGIKPSDEGKFDDNAGSLPSSITGGRSQIRSISGTLDGNSRILADAGVGGSATGANIVGDVSYEIDDILGGNGLSTLRGVAGQGESFSYSTLNGSTATLTLTGAGFVEIYDENGDNVIDDLVLRGTNSTSRLTMTTSNPGAISIGRVLSDDDCTLGSLSFDGELTGDGTAAPDLWLDGPISDFAIRSMGSGWSGRIGGDVNVMTIQSQGAGALQVGGRIRQLMINGSTTTALLENLSTADGGPSITEMAVSGGGATWVFDSAATPVRLGRADLNTGVITDWVSLRDRLGAVTPGGMDFDSADNLIAVARLYDPAPIMEVANAMSVSNVTLRGLAVSPTGQIVAVDSSSGVDHLVLINASTGGFTDYGLVRESASGSTFNGQIQQLAFDASGNLYALLSDADGTGDGFTSANGYALARLGQNSNYSNWWASGLTDDGATPAIISGGITERFTGLAVGPDGEIWTLRRNDADTGDVLSPLQVAGDGTVTRTNDYEITLNGGGTELVGIGFDKNGNLVGVSDGSMLFINTTSGLASVLGAADTVDGDLTAFAVGRSGDNYSTYAYDTSGKGRFFTNAGMVAVLGSINTGTGMFSRICSLLDAQANPLTDAIVSIAVDAEDTDDVLLVTDKGQLYRYGADGALVGALGEITDGRTGEALNISHLDFNENNELVGLDTTFKRLVTIDMSTALATGELPAGAIPTATSVAAMAFSPSSQAFYGVTGETFIHFLASNRTQYDELVGGITAHGVDTLNINAPAGYSGQITTNGNSFGSVNISGTFTGMLTTPGSMGAVTQRSGDFGGTLIADRAISSVTIVRGSFLPNALVQTDGALTSFTNNGVATGPEANQFAGVIDARSITQLTSAVDAVVSALVSVSGAASSVNFNGNAFAAHVNIGSIDRGLTVRGLMGGRIDIAGGASSITLTGGAASGSAITLGGDLQSLRSNGTFDGSLFVGGTLASATFNKMTGAEIVVGFGGNALSASGNVLDSLVSFGTGIDADGVYNTADDVIYGGTLRTATFRGDFTGSALVAGVLPSLSSGSIIPIPAAAYVGDLTAADLAEVDSAEAGGFFASGIGSASFARDVTGSAVAAADTLGTLTGPNVRFLQKRVYSDPMGAPQVASVDGVWNTDDLLTQVRVTFGEAVNTGSLSLSIDADDDGSVMGPADTQGSVLVRDGSAVLDDCTLSYEYDDMGRGVLVISRAEGVSTGDLSIRLAGAAEPWIYDRSGMRSGLRDFNQDGVAEIGEDPFGTLLDGNGDGVEGDDYVFSD